MPSFYSFRQLNQQTWLAVSVVGATVGACVVAYDTFRSRRGAVPLFDSARVQRVEEHARYPCTALRGLDLVVRNYYVAEDPAVVRRRQRARDDVVFLADADRAEAMRREAGAPLFSLARLRAMAAMFSNETHSPNCVETAAGRRILSDRDDLASIKLVESAPEEGAESGAPPRRRPAVASASWPPHTEKFVGFVLEPTNAAIAGAEEAQPSTLGHLRDPLRWLADSATHQSLIRCRGRSALVDMNCDPDPAHLGAAYLRVMLSAFLLLPSVTGSAANTSHPLRVAVLGVAGGSLPRFLQHHFSSIVKVMDLVDVEPACFRAVADNLAAVGAPGGVVGASTEVREHARDAVEFLKDHQRQMGAAPLVCVGPTTTTAAVAGAGGGAGGSRGTLPVFQDVSRGDAAAPRSRPYDLIFVDLFVGSELAPGVGGAEFARLCRQSLSAGGVVAVNLPERSRAFIADCERVFGKRNVYEIPTPRASNTVVLLRGGSAGAAESLPGVGRAELGVTVPHLSHRVLYRRARQLQETFQLPYDLANHYPAWWRFW